jgi:hypothetical protein
MRIIATILLLTIILSCSRNVLNLRHFPSYTESIQTELLKNKTLTINVDHDNKKVRDDGYTHKIIVTIMDSIKITSNNVININSDTSLLKFKYYISGFRIWDPWRNCTGTIKLSKWTNEFIVLKFRIKSFYADAGDRSENIYGRRKFKLLNK